MTAKKTDNSAPKDTTELTDDELNEVSGGIIFVGGEPVVTGQDTGANSSGGSHGPLPIIPKI
jgi:bacteriocin-like protein